MAIRIISFLTLTFLISCSSLPEKRILVEANPTSFIFDSNEEGLRQAILFELGDRKYQMMMLCRSSNRIRPYDTLEVKGQDDSFDYYLDSEEPWISNSYIYPDLPYIASFRMHLADIDETHTELIIYTINPRVIVGKPFLPSFPHFAHDFIYRNVEPSSIEEYEILLRIGKHLHQEMPAIKYPKK